MLSQNITVRIEGTLWVAFQLFAERVCPGGAKKKTSDVLRELIKETPEYAKIKGIPAVQEQVAPGAEDPSSKEGSEQDTQSNANGQEENK